MIYLLLFFSLLFTTDIDSINLEEEFDAFIESSVEVEFNNPVEELDYNEVYKIKEELEKLGDLSSSVEVLERLEILIISQKYNERELKALYHWFNY